MRQQHENPILTYRARLDAAAISLIDDLRVKLVDRGLEVDAGGTPRPGTVWIDGDLHQGWTVFIHGGSHDNYFTVRPPRPKITGGFDVDAWVVSVTVEVAQRRDLEQPNRVAEHHDDLAFLLGRRGFHCSREEGSFNVSEGVEGHLSDWSIALDGPGAVVDAVVVLLDLPLALYPDEEAQGMAPIALSTDEADLLLACGMPLEKPRMAASSFSSGLVATGGWRWTMTPSEVGAHRLVTPDGELAATVYPASGWCVWSPRGEAVKSGSESAIHVAAGRAAASARTCWRRRGWCRNPDLLT